MLWAFVLEQKSRGLVWKSVPPNGKFTRGLIKQRMCSRLNGFPSSPSHRQKPICRALMNSHSHPPSGRLNNISEMSKQNALNAHTHTHTYTSFNIHVSLVTLLNTHCIRNVVPHRPEHDQTRTVFARRSG